jgi:hypothetical protein
MQIYSFNPRGVQPTFLSKFFKQAAQKSKSKSTKLTFSTVASLWTRRSGEWLLRLGQPAINGI